MDIPETRRYKQTAISHEMLGLLIAGRVPPFSTNLPDDIKVVAVMQSQQMLVRGIISILIESTIFEPVPLRAEPPYFEVDIKGRT